MLSADTVRNTFLEKYLELNPHAPLIDGKYPKNPRSYIGSMLCVKDAMLGFKGSDGPFGCPKQAKHCEQCWNLMAEFDRENTQFIRIIEGMAVLDGISV